MSLIVSDEIDTDQPMNHAATGQPAAAFLSHGIPPLRSIADLLSWRPVSFAPIVWRDAFEAELERRTRAIPAEADPDGDLAQSLVLLPGNARRRFLRAPAVAMLLRRDAGNRFDARLYAQLVLAELAAAGIVTELPKSLWTARGDRFLDRSAPACWTLPGATLGDTGICVDAASPFQFPDDDFGIAETVPHSSGELEIALGRVLNAAVELRRACPQALALVTTFTEVLALRREPADVASFYSSTFPGCPGLVRFTNTHLKSADTMVLVESLVHEAIHCILHIHEELEEPFVCIAEANDAKVVSPWTGDTIRLQSYVHACAVWYGIYWLWSIEGFAAGGSREWVATLRQRALRGFQHRPVSGLLVPYNSLLTRSIKGLLLELEERMLSFP
jgi:hypothetical protein